MHKFDAWLNGLQQRWAKASMKCDILNLGFKNSARHLYFFPEKNPDINNRSLGKTNDSSSSETQKMSEAYCQSSHPPALVMVSVLYWVLLQFQLVLFRWPRQFDRIHSDTYMSMGETWSHVRRPEVTTICSSRDSIYKTSNRLLLQSITLQECTL